MTPANSIHRELQPVVIDDELLEKHIREQEPKGEAGRLAQLEIINYENITALRMEFQNILRIDHLWVLPNLVKLSLNYNRIDKIENLEMLTKLKDLDLSFNFIEKIEGLDTLVNLEVLSLFHNHIETIEGLDGCLKLIILSLGDNRISSKDGIERLIFMKHLNVLNISNNPFTNNKDEPMRPFVCALLPNLKYYNYSLIYESERIEGRKIYRDDIKIYEDAIKEEAKERERIAADIRDADEFSSSFVEHLNKHQLFDSLFVGDEDGDALLLIGEDAEILIEEYRTEAFEITQQIFKIGLAKHAERQAEIILFTKALEAARIEIQAKGQRIIEEFLKKKNQIFEDATNHLRTVEKEFFKTDSEPGEEIKNAMEGYELLLQEFKQMLDTTWTILMFDEVQLFERVSDAISQFRHVVNSMVNDFIEKAQALFVQLRDCETTYSDGLAEAVATYITMMATTGQTHLIPTELEECAEDKDAINNLVAGSKDFHSQVIDAREDSLVSRARRWAENLVDNLNESEVERNRTKVNEITYFTDYMQEDFQNISDIVKKEFEIDD